MSFPLRGPGPGDIGERLAEVQKWAGEWEQAARGPLRVEYKKVGGRHIGVNLIPGRAWVDGYEQAWAMLGAATDIRRLAALTEETRAACPRLVPWVASHPVRVLSLAAVWSHLLATVAWIDQHQAPGMYLRQVDVPGVDTKFIEKHKGVLTDLLEQQLDSGRIDQGTRDFEARFRFRRKPVYVRFRCERLSGTGFTELSVRADELTAPPPGTIRAYIIENEITYLAFPLAPGAIVILGGGYAVPVLESLAWLPALDIVYWGDIDTHGFAILNRLRHHVPRVRSILMDPATLLAHRDQWIREPIPTSAALDRLNTEEQSLYGALVTAEFGPAVRLEQERVSFAAIQRALAEAHSRLSRQAGALRPGAVADFDPATPSIARLTTACLTRVIARHAGRAARGTHQAPRPGRCQGRRAPPSACRSSRPPRTRPPPGRAGNRARS